MSVEIAAVMTAAWLLEKTIDEAGTRFAEATLRHIFRRRLEAAREIAIDEIRHGRGFVPLDVPAADEMVAILWRYQRAAEEGCARLNLRLMASVIAGKKEAPPVSANEFLRWSDLIASLSYEEIILLSKLHRECCGENPNLADTTTRALLIPSIFRDADEFDLAAFALIRTGLVLQTAMLAGGSAGLSGTFVTSSRMTRLAELADMEGILEREQR